MRDLNMENLSLPNERRKYPRYLINQPLIFEMTESPNVYAGLIINASKGGLQIQAMKDMSSGLKLNIELVFAMGSELSILEGMVRVIWKDDYNDFWVECMGYKYGLKFVQISKENRLKLKHFLWNKSNARDTSPQGNA
jgi:hypothetical protein